MPGQIGDDQADGGGSPAWSLEDGDVSRRRRRGPRCPQTGSRRGDGRPSLHIKDGLLEVEWRPSTPPPSPGPAIVTASSATARGGPCCRRRLGRPRTSPRTPCGSPTSGRAVQRRSSPPAQASTVVVRPEIEATDSRPRHRQDRGGKSRGLPTARQDAGPGVRWRGDLAFRGRENRGRRSVESAEEDLRGRRRRVHLKFASVKFIRRCRDASASRSRWRSGQVPPSRKKKTPGSRRRLQRPDPWSSRASRGRSRWPPPPEPPLAPIKERAPAEAARAAGEAGTSWSTDARGPPAAESCSSVPGENTPRSERGRLSPFLDPYVSSRCG